MNASPYDRAETITIVTGLPRSGTSMMMQMLNAGGIPPWTDKVRESDADNPKGYYEYEKVKSLARDNSWLAEAKGHAIKIVAPLLPSLPAGAYHIIFMKRDMDEVLRSQSEMLKRSAKSGARLSPEQLASVFQGHLRRAEEMIKNAAYPALSIEHRKCLDDPAAVAGEVSSFFGGELDEAAMAAAVDGTLYRQRA